MNIRRTSGPCINPPTPPQWPSSQFKNLHSRQFSRLICGVFDTIQEIGILDIEYKWKVLKLIPCWKRLMNINQNSAIVHLLQLSPRKFGLIETMHYGLRPIERGQFRFIGFCMKISLSLSNSMIFSRPPLLKTREKC